MKVRRQFSEPEALLRRFLALAASDDWNVSGKLDDILEDTREYLVTAGAVDRWEVTR